MELFWSVEGEPRMQKQTAAREPVPFRLAASPGSFRGSFSKHGPIWETKAASTENKLREWGINP